MKAFILTILALILTFFSSCKNTKTEVFGKDFKEDTAISISDALPKVTDSTTLDVVLKGNVESVCQTKGCWMYLEDPADKENYVLVEFKDYGFFVPMNSEGRETYINGTLSKEITSVETLKHLAEDEGQSEAEIAAITNPTLEYKFEASGVKMMP